MNIFVAVTDYEWFVLRASEPRVEEVNFWRPSSEAPFKALKTGEMMRFKLHSPRNFIAGGGFFTRFVFLPIRFLLHGRRLARAVLDYLPQMN